MKKYLYILLLILPFAFSSCKVGIMTQSTGLPDQGFIEIVSKQNHKPVFVELDGKSRFEATVQKQTKMNVKGRRYALSTGKHLIKVFDRKGRMLYSRVVLISPQQTKVIWINKNKKWKSGR